MISARYFSILVAKFPSQDDQGSSLQLNPHGGRVFPTAEPFSFRNSTVMEQ